MENCAICRKIILLRRTPNVDWFKSCSRSPLGSYYHKSCFFLYPNHNRPQIILTDYFGGAPKTRLAKSKALEKLESNRMEACTTTSSMQGTLRVVKPRNSNKVLAQNNTKLEGARTSTHMGFFDKRGVYVAQSKNHNKVQPTSNIRMTLRPRPQTGRR